MISWHIQCFVHIASAFFSFKWRNLHTSHFSDKKPLIKLGVRVLKKIELLLCDIVVEKKIARGISGASFFGEKCLKPKFVTDSALFWC